MKSKARVGEYLKASGAGGVSYLAYVPPPLPLNPPLNMDDFYPLFEKATIALGRLDGVGMLLPNLELLIYMYARKEAVLSSQIEGTQSSLSDLLLFEGSEERSIKFHEIKEVSRYVAAMEYGLEALKKLPLSLRLIRKVHEKLMHNARGGGKQAGEFRTIQNWIGGNDVSKAFFVPVPPQKLGQCLDDFEKFIHDKKIKIPVLIKAALLHAQFETIHPFLDGNGRLGRLLIIFVLHSEGVIKEPLLYLSLYFKTNRQDYYDHLQSTRETGDWESWIIFFLEGIIDTANQATGALESIANLFKEDRARIENSGRSTSSILAIYSYLKKRPICDTTDIREHIGRSLTTVISSLAVLEELGIVKEITGKTRHKIFTYRKYLGILDSGTEL